MGKKIMTPILLMALVTAIFAPPAQAELVTITVVLVAAFGVAIVTSEVVKSWDENEVASNDPGLTQENSMEYADLGL